MVNLLKSSGDKDPKILEKFLQAIYYVLKYMQKILVKDIAYVMNRFQCWYLIGNEAHKMVSIVIILSPNQWKMSSWHSIK